MTTLNEIVNTLLGIAKKVTRANGLTPDGVTFEAQVRILEAENSALRRHIQTIMRVADRAKV